MTTVDVVIPARHGVGFLPEALDSVIAQTGCDPRIWIVDDGAGTDLAALVPFDLIAILVGAGSLKLIRVIRVLRLVKMARLVRASVVVQQWEVTYAVNYALLDLVMYVLKVLF